jgi:hypothetical protein
MTELSPSPAPEGPTRKRPEHPPTNSAWPPVIKKTELQRESPITVLDEDDDFLSLDLLPEVLHHDARTYGTTPPPPPLKTAVALPRNSSRFSLIDAAPPDVPSDPELDEFMASLAQDAATPSAEVRRSQVALSEVDSACAQEIEDFLASLDEKEPPEEAGSDPAVSKEAGTDPKRRTNQQRFRTYHAKIVANLKRLQEISDRQYRLGGALFSKNAKTTEWKSLEEEKSRLARENLALRQRLDRIAST